MLLGPVFERSCLMPDSLNERDPGPVPCATVLREELKQIDQRRHLLGFGGQRNEPSGVLEAEDCPEEKEFDRELVGLALSGGGIRSATFNLGLLQGLARLGLLPFIDYLSTVSGGGYVGSWLVAWIQRGGGLKAVQKQLGQEPGSGGVSGAPRDPPSAPDHPAPALSLVPGLPEPGTRQEPGEVRHLRSYSNYIAPRPGFLSADSWVLVAAYLRNLLLCQLVLLPAVIAVLLVPRIVMLVYFPWRGWRPPFGDAGSYSCTVAGVAALFWLAAFVRLFRPPGVVCGAEPGKVASSRIGETDPRPEEDTPVREEMGVRELWVVLVLFCLGAIAFCLFAPYPLKLVNEDSPWGRRGDCFVRLTVFAGSAAVLVSLGYLIGIWADRRWGVGLAVVFVGGLAWGTLLYGAYEFLHELYKGNDDLNRDYVWVRGTARLVTFGPPVVLVTLVIVFSLAQGLLKRGISENQREWWASVCGRLLIVAAVWVAVNLVALYGTALVLWAGPWVRAAIGSGWLLAVLTGVLAGYGPNTGTGRPKSPWLEWLVRLAPPLFLAGLLVLVSLLIHQVIDNPPQWDRASDTVWTRTVEPARPPRRVTEISVRQPYRPDESAPVRTEVEHAEVINDAAVIQQMYWLGMLNSDPNFVPIDRYWLSRKYDLPRLKSYGISESVLYHLAETELVAPPSDSSVRGLRVSNDPFEIEKDGYSRKDFLQRLDKTLPLDTPYSHRFWILQRAKNVQSINKDTGYLWAKLLLCLLVCIAVVVLAAWRVDVNLFSLHSLYGNRLVRAYLGASRKRTCNAITGLDFHDDMPLANLRIGNDRSGRYDGPFLIINTTMNLVHGERLDWQERKASSFTLTPLYCGWQTSPDLCGGNYRLTKDGYGGGMTLGTAMTISGAAASPNMGYHSSPPVTALLTVFNARLGAWLGNPASPAHWRSSGPRLGFVHLFRELFGLTGAKGRYVYLSDGGHFENLGAYELVRRRCRYVIISDAGCDGGHTFENLGNFIHKCQVDFGIRIEIDLSSLRLDESRHCQWHCAVGKIRYDDVDRCATPGTLVYLKASLTGDEPADVLHYAKAYRDFPHETTLDQFFAESQFESYRALGKHVAEAVFERPADEMNEVAPSKDHHARCQALFSSLVRRWRATPAGYEATCLLSTDGYIAVQKAIRGDPRLLRLSMELYPELEPEWQEQALESKETFADRAARRHAELHAVAHMIRVMEHAWLSLNLKDHYAHALSRGWLSIFHRWTSAKTVRDYWPILRAEFSRDFVRFCEKRIGMGGVGGTTRLFQGVEEVPELLRREIREQCPDRGAPEDEIALALLKWLIYPMAPGSFSDSPASGSPSEGVRFPCGILLVSPAEPERIGGAVADGERLYELFVWLRGAYRNTGIGQAAVKEVLGALEAPEVREIVRELLRPPFQLRVRMPEAILHGPGGKEQRALWWTFFNHLRFKRLDPQQAGAPQAGEGAEGEEVVVVERHFPGP